MFLVFPLKWLPGCGAMNALFSLADPFELVTAAQCIRTVFKKDFLFVTVSSIPKEDPGRDVRHPDLPDSHKCRPRQGA